MITPNDIFEDKIRNLFKKEKTTDMDLILEVLSLIIYNTQNNTDIIELYKLLNLDSFVKIITLFDGRIVKFPTKKFLRNSLLLSILYYYREIKNKSWEEIKQEFPFDISSISYGIQIKNLNNFIRQKMYEILKNLDDKEVNENVKEFFKQIKKG